MDIIEYYNNIKTRILLETPFTDDELNINIVGLAIERSLSKLNRYRPLVTKTYGSASLVNDSSRILRDYTSGYMYDTQNPFFDYGDDDIVGDLRIHTTDWTLETITDDNIDKSRATKSFFNDLVVAYSALFMSNTRRSVGLSSLPFDLKGDQYFDFYNQLVSDIDEKMVNTMDNTL